MRSVIAIDGPAGAGKSTIAREIAQKLSFAYFDSGAVYRVLTLYLIRKFGEIDEKRDHSQDLDECAAGVDLEFEQNDRKVFLFGEDVTQELRKEAITRQINKIANNGGYREKANRIIKKYAQRHDMVIDGRDIGTGIFPNTPFKFYLDASWEIRASRRYRELMEFPGHGANQKLEKISLEQIAEDIRKRDFLDENRPVGPLRRAQDAILINSDDLSVDQVVQIFFEKISRIKNALEAKETQSKNR